MTTRQADRVQQRIHRSRRHRSRLGLTGAGIAAGVRLGRGRGSEAERRVFGFRRSVTPAPMIETSKSSS